MDIFQILFTKDDPTIQSDGIMIVIHYQYKKEIAKTSIVTTAQNTMVSFIRPITDKVS